MWAEYITWIKSRTGPLTNRQLDAYLSSHGWTYIELRNEMNPGLYGVKAGS